MNLWGLAGLGDFSDVAQMASGMSPDTCPSSCLPLQVDCGKTIWITSILRIIYKIEVTQGEKNGVGQIQS